MLSLPALLRRRRAPARLALDSLDVGDRIVSARVRDPRGARTFVGDQLGSRHPRLDDACELAARLVARALQRQGGSAAAPAREPRLALTITPKAVRVEVRADGALGALVGAGAGTEAVGEGALVGRLATRWGFTHDRRGGGATWCELGDLESHR